VRLASLLVALILASGAAQSLAAQTEGVQLDLVLPSPQVLGGEGPSIVTSNLLAAQNTRELLRNGFPTELRFRAELWRKSRWFDEQAGVTEWRFLVRYEPSSQLYSVVRQRGRNEVEDFGGFASLTSAELQIDRPYKIPVTPGRPGRYYYNLSLEIQTLTVSDLDALQRWLKGEAQPAVQGRNNPLTAIKNGVETLLSRVLGGENRRYVQRTGVFTVQ